MGQFPGYQTLDKAPAGALFRVGVCTPQFAKVSSTFFEIIICGKFNV